MEEEIPKLNSTCSESMFQYDIQWIKVLSKSFFIFLYFKIYFYTVQQITLLSIQVIFILSYLYFPHLFSNMTIVRISSGNGLLHFVHKREICPTSLEFSPRTHLRTSPNLQNNPLS